MTARRAATGVVRGTRPGPLVVVGALAWAAMVVLQISTAGVSDPRTLVTLIVVLLAVAVWCYTARLAGARAALLCLVIAAAVGLVAESVGTRSAVPFGRYTYTAALRPQLIGVPTLVPLAWFAMGVAAYAVAVAIIGRPERLSGRWWVRCLVGAWALTAWDLFLDPQMVALGYWRWPGGGQYGGIPISNYVGWFLVSVVLMIVLDAVLHVVPVSRGLLGLYTSMAVTETVGFLGPLQLRPSVAVVGGIGMGLPAAAAWWATRRGPAPTTVGRVHRV